MISVSHFSKRYGRFWAVRDVSFEVPRGQVFGFIGRNGAGKTTTIRFLATLIRATAGDGTIAGFSVRRHSREVRQHLGYVPDNFAEFSGFRVKTFLDFFARAYGVPRARRRQRVEELLERLGLTPYSGVAVRNLSRGLKQRLYLARALVHDPPVLILDEPTTGLDPMARVDFKRLIRDLAQQGKTILLSSHVLGEISDVATSVGIIERGRLLMAGPISEVLARSQRPQRVRLRYLGDRHHLDQALARVINRFRCVESTDGQVLLQIDGATQDPAGQAEILRELILAGLAVTEFAPVFPTLEELFLESTERGCEPRAEG